MTRFFYRHKSRRARLPLDGCWLMIFLACEVNIDVLINIMLLSFMVVTALAFVFVRNLFAVVMLSSVFSLTAALLYLTMDAVDVAFTEAAVRCWHRHCPWGQ